MSIQTLDSTFGEFTTISLRSHYSNSTFAYLIAYRARNYHIRSATEIKHNIAILGNVMMMTGLRSNADNWVG